MWHLGENQIGSTRIEQDITFRLDQLQSFLRHQTFFLHMTLHPRLKLGFCAAVLRSCHGSAPYTYDLAFLFQLLKISVYRHGTDIRYKLSDLPDRNHTLLQYIILDSFSSNLIHFSAPLQESPRSLRTSVL